MGSDATIREAIERAASAFGGLRGGIAVHCLTNTVAQGFTANILLAIGVRPSMTDSTDEVGHFVQAADALLVNLGTLHAEQRAATKIAVDLINELGRPWVLDPVFSELSPPRADFARALVAQGPTVLRGNGGEIGLLAPDGLAGTALVETGTVDRIRHGDCRYRVANGHGLLAQVTASGCAGAAVTAALTAVTDDPAIAGLAGALAMGIAGERAALEATGPGHFAVHLIDHLAALTPQDIIDNAQVT